MWPRQHGGFGHELEPSASEDLPCRKSDARYICRDLKFSRWHDVEVRRERGGGANTVVVLISNRSQFSRSVPNSSRVIL
ncbi:hypothetical protein TNCV_2696491 [Trichonephila clavipes]|nr:hypothetical protein TNCV_2696491 [Trichonephila clavipes]